MKSKLVRRALLSSVSLLAAVSILSVPRPDLLHAAPPPTHDLTFPAAAPLDLDTAADDITLDGVVSQDEIAQNGLLGLTDGYKDDLSRAEYATADGDRALYMFGTPVKYVADGGQTAYIKNEVIANSDGEKQNGSDWKNKANVFTVYFSKKIDKGVTLKVGNAKLADSFPSVDQKAGKAYTASADGKSVTYAAQGADGYAYAAASTGYAATVTMRAQESVTVRLACDVLSNVVANENGSVSLYSSGALFSTICPSDVTDADGNIVSTATHIAVTPVDVKKGVYDVTFSFDWDEGVAIICPLTFTYGNKLADEVLAAENAKFKKAPNNGLAKPNMVATPMSLTKTSADPAQNKSSDRIVYDSYVYQGSATLNYGLFDNLNVGRFTGTNDAQIYTRFDLSGLNIRYDQVVSACYSIYQYCNYTDTIDPFYIELHEVTGSWTETGINWNNKPAYDPHILQAANIKYEADVHNIMSLYNFMLTSTVEGWMQGLPNNGIMIKQTDYTDYAIASGNYRQFYSYDYTGANAAKFILTYTPDTTAVTYVGIMDGKNYYIKNKGSVTSANNPPSPLYLTTPGTAAKTYCTAAAFSSAQKWKVTASTTSGYFKLSPAVAPSMVLSGDGTKWQIDTSGSLAAQNFKFIRNWDGSYHIVSQNGTVLAMNSMADKSIYPKAPVVNKNFLDDWTIEEADNTNAGVYQNSNVSIINGIEIKLNNIGYVVSTGSDVGSTTMLSQMGKNSVIFIQAHGGGSFFETPLGSGNNQGIAASILQKGGTYDVFPISSCTDNFFANSKLILDLSCSTGLDAIINNTHVSLTDQLYRKGAHCVITFNDTISAQNWISRFFNYAQTSNTIQEAIDRTDASFLAAGDDSGNGINRNIMGDTSICINRNR